MGGPGATVQIVTNATNITAGAKYIVALAGVTLANGKEVSEGKVGGVESVGTFCDSKMMGWDTDELEENMAVILDDDSPIGNPNPTYEEALQAFKDRQTKAAAAAVQKEAGETKGGKKDKKKKGKKAEAD